MEGRGQGHHRVEADVVLAAEGPGVGQRGGGHQVAEVGPRPGAWRPGPAPAGRPGSPASARPAARGRRRSSRSRRPIALGPAAASPRSTAVALPRVATSAPRPTSARNPRRVRSFSIAVLPARGIILRRARCPRSPEPGQAGGREDAALPGLYRVPRPWQRSGSEFGHSADVLRLGSHWSLAILKNRPLATGRLYDRHRMAGPEAPRPAEHDGRARPTATTARPRPPRRPRSTGRAGGGSGWSVVLAGLGAGAYFAYPRIVLALWRRSRPTTPMSTPT